MAESAPARLGLVGVSVSANCGVHDQARLLGSALEDAGIPCSFHWLRREAATLRGAMAEFAAFRRKLERELAAEPLRALMLHYSVFSFSYRGLPLFTAPCVHSLRRRRLPLIAEVHEAAYPFGPGGARGTVWASTQRLALAELMRAVSGALVTAEWRAEWLRSSRWLPTRPVLTAPVFSNLPPPRAPAGERAGSAEVGIFGYSYESIASALTLDALARLRAAGVRARLRLLGAPGADSPSGERWLQQARAAGVAEALEFSGRLPAQELSDELAACEVLLFPDTVGPDSRKSTLAAALASGVPVLALDGPKTWSLLRDAAALRLAQPSGSALAGALGELLADAALRRELGARGRAFAEREMSPGAAVRAVRELLGDAA